MMNPKRDPISRGSLHVEVEELNYRGVQLGNEGRLQEALALFEQVLKLDPVHARAWKNKGLVLYHQEKHQEALQCFDRAMELRPDFPRALVAKSSALLALERFVEALACCDQVIELGLVRVLRMDTTVIDFAQAWGNKGFALAKLGRIENAITALQEAVRVNPDDEVNRSNLEKLEAEHHQEKPP